MKWIILILLLTWSISGWLDIEDGFSSNNPTYTICRNPFCIRGTATVTCNPPTWVLITNPVNGSYLYWSPPSITENTTVDSSEGVATKWEYKIDSGLWNSFTHTGNIVNATHDMVTYPEGYPITLTVNVSNSCGWITNTSVIYVYGHPSAISESGGTLLFFICGLLIIFTIIEGHRKYYGKNIQRK